MTAVLSGIITVCSITFNWVYFPIDETWKILGSSPKLSEYLILSSHILLPLSSAVLEPSVQPLMVFLLIQELISWFHSFLQFTFVTNFFVKLYFFDMLSWGKSQYRLWPEVNLDLSLIMVRFKIKSIVFEHGLSLNLRVVVPRVRRTLLPQTTTS